MTKIIDEFEGVQEIVYKTVYVSPQKVKVVWFNNDGKVIDENYNGTVNSYMFCVYVDGISYENIDRVEFPSLSYENNGEYLVKVTYREKEIKNEKI
jgi:hypothetical protein